MKYLKYFPTEAEYNAFIQSDNFILPNVSYALDTDNVFYNIVKTESGDYKIFLLEKKDISGLTYNMVDLGLPSGLLWSDRNVGASAPEDFGTMFAWGETEGYNVSIKYCTEAELCDYMNPLVGDEMELTPDNIDDILNELHVIDKDITSIGMGFATDKCFSDDWSDYFDTTDGGSTFNKYATDKLTVLQPEDDAATVNMGSEYRMPTKADFEELINNTTPTFIDLQDNEFSASEVENIDDDYFRIKVIKFTSNNGNSISIPLSGICLENSCYNVYLCLIQWSSSLYSNNSRSAKGLCCYFNNSNEIGDYSRNNGHSVRAVK